MATLSVLKFNNPEGADQALRILQGLQQQQLIQVLDAAVVSWPEGAKAPKTRQALNTAGAGALGGAFWGLLFGLIFFIPLIGLAIGAGMGALTGAMTDVGIDDNFIKQSRDKVTPGTSALFVMTEGAVVDRVVPALQSLSPELITTNLSTEQEAQLRELFTPDQTQVEGEVMAEGESDLQAEGAVMAEAADQTQAAGEVQAEGAVMAEAAGESEDQTQSEGGGQTM